MNITPYPSPPHPGVVALAAGEYHTCALLSGGGVDCWGYNYNGQLGTGDWTDKLTPTRVTELTAGTKFLKFAQTIFPVHLIIHKCMFSFCQIAAILTAQVGRPDLNNSRDSNPETSNS